jgi:hypothetical protein
LLRLLRSTSVRLALGYAALFVVSSLLLGIASPQRRMATPSIC